MRQQNLNNHNLAFWEASKIKINQATIVYDSTGALRDTNSVPVTPPNTYYNWEVIPSNGCDSILGDRNLAIISVAFRCSGTYLVTAKIYDSLTHDFLGSTDTTAITVISDTLHPVQPIKDDDTLNLQVGIEGVDNERWLSLILESTKLYDGGLYPYTQFDYTRSVTQNNYSFIISGAVLTTYPFLQGTTNKVVSWIDLKGMSYGVPSTVNIKWLGRTYTLELTLLNEHQYLLTAIDPPAGTGGALRLH